MAATVRVPSPTLLAVGSRGRRRRPGLPPRLETAARGLRLAFEALGLEASSDPHLQGTERRLARALGELFAGLRADEPELRTFPNAEGYSRPVSVAGIRFHSLCAHHLLPFFGTVDVAYIPNDRLVGLSKLARLVDHFARRPQVQERFTEQLAQSLEQRLQPRGVLVVVRARHFCMEMRGVEQAGALTSTSSFRGDFAESELRHEFRTDPTVSTPRSLGL